MIRLLLAAACAAVLAAPLAARADDDDAGRLALTPPVLLEPAGPPLSIEPHLRRDQLLATAALTLVATPSAYALAAALGKSSNDLYAAALPAVLVGLLLPPAAAALASWGVGRQSERVKVGPWLAFLAGFAAHAAATTVGVLLGVSIDKPGPLMLLILVDTLATTAATVFTMDAAADARPAPAPAAVPAAAVRLRPGDPPLPQPLAVLPLFHADF